MRTDEKQLKPFAVNRAEVERKFPSVSIGLIVVLGTCCLLGAGCATPKESPISRLMLPAATPSVTPPAGKSLVFVHRPLTELNGFYLGVWDGTSFIADLGNGHSLAYVCSPGRHVFSSRLVSNVAVVEANLLPNQTYDLSSFNEFKIAPVKPGDKKASVSKWMQEARWIGLGPLASSYEPTRVAMTAQLIEDFTVGKKKHRLLQLAPEDHR